jgi:hypothetical protein
MADFRKSVFTPQNPAKLIGKSYCQARSSWETRFMRFLDKNPSILEWSSESIAIPYIDPVTRTLKRYFPDFLIKYKDRDNNIVMELIEIKPFKQTVPPVITKGKKRKTLLTEARVWSTNSAKWKAAQEYCKLRGLKFRIITERELNL